MEKRSRSVCVLVAAVLATAALGGCSNGGSGMSAPDETKAASPTATASPTAKASPTATGPAHLALRTAGSLGKILTDAKGRTLYLFEADTTTKSTCNGACAAAWPPLTTMGQPMAGPGLKASLVSTSTRDDGKKQVVYNKHPLYYYSGDTKPGDTNGQDLNAFGAKWYVLDAAGKKVEAGGNG
jgi:predicted lipoprotein with Yx(FWY)xxD motif